jgi:hypothetical protein
MDADKIDQSTVMKGRMKQCALSQPEDLAVVVLYRNFNCLNSVFFSY